MSSAWSLETCCLDNLETMISLICLNNYLLPDWRTCASNNECARMCITEYLSNFVMQCSGKRKAGKVTCMDYAKLYYNGMLALNTNFLIFYLHLEFYTFEI